MAILLPDIIQHSNPNYPIIEDSEVKGGYKYVPTVDDRDLIPINKRKLGAVVGYVSGGNLIVKGYNGADLTDPNWTNVGNWIDIGGSGAPVPIVKTLTSDDTTTFVVGDKTLVKKVILDFEMQRVNEQACGKISIYYNSGTDTVMCLFEVTELSGDIGIAKDGNNNYEISAALNSNDIELSIIVDDSSVTDITMTYTVVQS